MSSSFPPPGTNAAYPAPAAPEGQPNPWGTAQQWQSPMPMGYQPPRQRNGLAIAAIVMSGLALLGVLGIAVVMGLAVAAGPSYVLQGQVDPIGKTVTGQALSSSLTKVIEDDGGQVDEVTCPDSSAVGQGLVTVCHGSVDGSDWTGVVVFEDESGTFILDEL
jgi:hypothetical protein